MNLFKLPFGGIIAAVSILFVSQSNISPASASTLVFEFNGTVNYGLSGTRTQAELDAFFANNIFTAVLTVESTTAPFSSDSFTSLDRGWFDFTSMDITVGGQSVSWTGDHLLNNNNVVLDNYTNGVTTDVAWFQIHEEQDIGAPADGFSIKNTVFQMLGPTNSISDPFDINSLTSFLGGTNSLGFLGGSILDSSGTQAFTFSGATLTGQQVSAVPEPATWIMMILGFAGMGLALKSRRRRYALTA